MSVPDISRTVPGLSVMLRYDNVTGVRRPGTRALMLQPLSFLSFGLPSSSDL